MAEKNDDGLLSAGKISKELGVSAGKVKKAITELGLEPANVRCGCNYYSKKDVARIKKAVS